MDRAIVCKGTHSTVDGGHRRPLTQVLNKFSNRDFYIPLAQWFARMKSIKFLVIYSSSQSTRVIIPYYTRKFARFQLKMNAFFSDLKL